MKCVAAPIRKSTRNTTVTGRSRSFVGIPPNIASWGANGPTAFFPDITIPAVAKPEAVGADAPNPVAEAIVNTRDEDSAAVPFSNRPAANPLRAAAGSACTETLEVEDVGGSVTVLAAGVSVIKTVTAGEVFGDGGICVASNDDCGVETTVIVETTDDITGTADIDDDSCEVTAVGVRVRETTTVVVATCEDE